MLFQKTRISSCKCFVINGEAVVALTLSCAVELYAAERGVEITDELMATGDVMQVNFGPNHPSTHGVLRLIVDLYGEDVVGLEAVIGYLHTGFEKSMEQKSWWKAITYPERVDYLSFQANEMAFVMAIEKLLGIEIPERVQDIRVLIAELQRMASHLVWIGTHAMEIGAVSMLFYAIRERELLLNINELVAGFRFFPSYFRIGGLREDLPRGFHEAVRAFLDRFPGKLDEFEGLLTKNDMFVRRTKGVGVVSHEDALAWGLVGPIARASGSDYDVRKYFPYLGYETYDFDVPTATEGDVYARYRVRVAEMRQSVRIARQAIDRISPTGVWSCGDTRVVPPPKDKVYSEMEALIQHFLIHSQGFTVPAGEAYVPIESPKGEKGYYFVSDGTAKPVRWRIRPPSYVNLSAIPRMVEGHLLSDVIAINASSITTA